MGLDKIVIGYLSIGLNLWLMITILTSRKLDYSIPQVISTLKSNWIQNIVFILGWIVVLPPLLFKGLRS